MSRLYENDDIWETTHRPIDYSKPEAISFIYDHLGNQRLIYPQKQAKLENIADKTFHRNEVFWAEILDATRYYNYRNVVLEGFQIIDWFPRSPGLIFTLDAAKALEGPNCIVSQVRNLCINLMEKDWFLKVELAVINSIHLIITAPRTAFVPLLQIHTVILVFL